MHFKGFRTKHKDIGKKIKLLNVLTYNLYTCHDTTKNGGEHHKKITLFICIMTARTENNRDVTSFIFKLNLIFIVFAFTIRLYDIY